MRAVLVGHGKFGKATEEALRQRNHDVVEILTSKNFEQIDELQSSDYDIIFDCSPGEAFCVNYPKYLDIRKPVVVGSTGWHNRLDIIDQFRRYNVSAVFGSNFSVGIGLILKILEDNHELFRRAGLDLAILDCHHKNKRDAPSGTAVLIKDAVMGSYPEAPVASLRFGTVFGEHCIFLDSEFETIEIKHSAKNRKGFALGMVLSGEFLVNHPGCYEFRQIFQKVLQYHR